MNAKEVKALEMQLARLKLIVEAISALYRCHYDVEMRELLKKIEVAKVEK